MTDGFLDTVGLIEEPHIIRIGVTGVCLEDVVGKEDIRDLVLMDVIHHIFREIA